MTDAATKHDIVVIGAGPAGLTAGLYLGRYRRDVLIVHDGTSRVLRIPLTHNAPGFPDGIEGRELIDRMTRHATDYGAKVEKADITLMPLSHPELSGAQTAELTEAGIVVETGALGALEPGEDRMHVRLAGRERPLSFDVVYPALGTRPRGELAAQLGVRRNEAGCVPVRAIEDSGVPGFFAAGDVIDGLDQISVAMGHGAMAATHAHNWLREQDRHSLQVKA